MGDLKPLREPATEVDVDTLLARLTAPRAGYLDNLNNANLLTIDDISSLTAIEIGYLANINNVNLSTIANISSLTAAEIAHLDADISAVVQQIGLTGHPAGSIGKILYDFYNTRLTTARCGYLANINNTNLSTIANISTLTATEIAHLNADISSRAPASEYDTEMGYITEAVATEAKQDTIDGIVDDIKAKTDNLPAANAFVSGNFTWVTATHLSNEGDISALFSTNLTGTTRRRYAVYVDMTGPEADAAAWTTCTVRVKIGFGVGDAYRTVDLKEIAKTDVAAAKEPGVPIDVPTTAKNVQITLQFDVALNADATIYYCYAKETLE